jgi:AP-1 complex subunit mu
MAASALFILDLKGHVILFRDYRGDIPIKHAERFITKLNELEEAGKVCSS